jgi:hypothetical protein
MRTALALVFAAGLASLAQAQLAVTTTSPALNANNVSRSAPIVIAFDRPVDTATFTPANFRVFGKITGPVLGSQSWSNGNRTLTFQPGAPFFAAESIMVVMSRNLRGADNVALRNEGYSFMFNAGVAPSFQKFQFKRQFSNRDQTGAQTRIYGGLACDLNRDGFTDLTTINEVSSDLRVFMNNGAGDFGPLVTPYTPIPVESSPNDVADFDQDGFIDVVVSSYQTSTIAVAWGNGDGTFDQPLVLNVGSTPRGFGVIDVDGDGDLDITVANAGSNTISIWRSNSNRTFTAAANVNVSGGPYGMTNADMNRDGIMDLVVGTVNSQEVKVLRGNGNSTFTQIDSSPAGGQNWVVMAADLNGDGNVDVSTANSFSANGSILFGSASGAVGSPAVMPTGGHTVSTDLADLDGDGDLDWVLSSFGASEWYVYINNGAGVFEEAAVFPAPNNPSCAVPADYDNDGDIDLLLTDEIADVIIMMENTCEIDFNNDGSVFDPQDIDAFLSVYSEGPCIPAGATCDSIDFNNDNSFFDPDDIDAFLRVFSEGPCTR